jgi:membrane protease YdiL (CAAX protease family)
MADAAPAPVTGGRAKLTFRVALYLFVFLAGTLVLGVGLALGFGPGLFGQVGVAGEGVVGPAGVLIAAVTAGAAGATTWLFLHWEQRPWSTVGLDRRDGWMAELAAGIGLGAALMAGIAALEIGTGWYRFDGTVAAMAAVRDLGFGLVVYAAVAVGEELVTRGYVLQRLAEGWGRSRATVVSSLIFGLLHIGNPGSGPIPVLGIFMAGLMLAQAYWLTGRLWLPTGLHWAWNYFQGPVFGFPVSGTGASGLLQLVPVGPEPLTGGAFGPEASLIGAGACLVGFIILARFRVAAPV